MQQIENQITTKQLIKQFNITKATLFKYVRQNLPEKQINKGAYAINTFNKNEVTILLEAIKKGSEYNRGNQIISKVEASLNNKNINSMSTELTPILKLQRLQAEMQAIYEAENNRLKAENEQQKEVIQDYKLTIENKINKQELFSKINDLIRTKAKEKFYKNYAESYKYYYQKFANRHNIYSTIDMEFFKKNINYAKELLEILLNDNS